jgi:hypothetical protein
METFYFLCHPRRNRNELIVIDLAYSCDYELHDWTNVNDMTFTERDDAIKFARKFAKENNLEYFRFISRYNSELNEKENEFEEDSDTSLTNFVEEMHTSIEDFKKYWIENNKKSHETFPLIFEADNAGLWLEQFLMFISQEGH